ncbi:ATP-dependent DNA helicase PIF1, partial [Araneus ventricosus]
GIFFLDAPGGTGKTFLINLLLAKVRQRKEIALAVASSGIAATLLTGGRTAHSAFRLPLNLANTETPTCNISRNSGKAKILKDCKLIVWDECTMSHKAAFEALDVTLKDIRRNNNRMGGVTMVLAGDFRQTLPVIPRGTRADEMQACLKSSYLWNGIQRLGLTTNMRVHLNGEPSAQQFADNLLQLGNGAMTPDNQDGCIAMQRIGRIVKTQQELKEAVFPNVSQHFFDHSWLCQRAILAPRNEDVSIMNKQLLLELPGSVQVYKSIDTTCDTNEAVNYPADFLNTLEPSGVPSHTLELKIGAPIMLLRNLHPPSLCNGTRLCIKKLMPNIIEGTIMTGQFAGEDVFIPRIPIIPSDFPFQFKRLQFPVRLSFAMSINKAQGQSLKVVGLDLLKPCFSHGQLYVGCSRVGNVDNLYILAPDGRTTNIVYPEAL